MNQKNPNETLRTENEQLRNQNESLRTENEQLRAQNEDLRTTNYEYSSIPFHTTPVKRSPD